MAFSMPARIHLVDQLVRSGRPVVVEGVELSIEAAVSIVECCKMMKSRVGDDFEKLPLDVLGKICVATFKDLMAYFDARTKEVTEKAA